MQMVSWILKNLEIHCYKEALKIHLFQTTLCFPSEFLYPLEFISITFTYTL